MMLKKSFHGLFQLAKQKPRGLLCSIYQTFACLINVRRILAPL